jgi:hypothetical protein
MVMTNEVTAKLLVYAMFFKIILQHIPSTYKKNVYRPCVAGYAINPSTWEVETEGS